MRSASASRRTPGELHLLERRRAGLDNEARMLDALSRAERAVLDKTLRKLLAQFD